MGFGKLSEITTSHRFGELREEMNRGPAREEGAPTPRDATMVQEGGAGGRTYFAMATDNPTDLKTCLEVAGVASEVVHDAPAADSTDGTANPRQDEVRVEVGDVHFQNIGAIDSCQAITSSAEIMATTAETLYNASDSLEAAVRTFQDKMKDFEPVIIKSDVGSTHEAQVDGTIMLKRSTE